MKIASTACIVNAAVIIVIFATLMIAEYRADLSAESLNVSKNNAATAQYKRRGCVILIKMYNYKDN